MQIDLFSKQVRQELATALDTREDLDAAAKRAGFYPMLFDICEVCPLADCCCGDECHPLDWFIMWYFVEHKGRAKASAKAMRAALRRRDELILKGLPPLELKVTDSDGNEY